MQDSPSIHNKLDSVEQSKITGEGDWEEIQDEEVYFESQMTTEHHRGETTSVEGEK